jgi:uncharacterized protein (DUF2342 family)
MSTNLPFGFNPQGDQPGGSGDDITGKIPLFAELRKLMSWSGGPVNWDLARQIAISGLASDHRLVRDGEREQVTDAACRRSRRGRASSGSSARLASGAPCAIR